MVNKKTTNVYIMALLILIVTISGCKLPTNETIELPQKIKKILASDGAEGDTFGVSVSISGDYMVVGAPYSGFKDSGAAYVFHRTGFNTWDKGVKLTASNKSNYDDFGRSVAIYGDYIVIGSPQDDDKGTNSGSAYVFHRTGGNTWVEELKLLASDGLGSDTFGNSVSISGDYIVVGASNGDSSVANTGAAYVFNRTVDKTWDSGKKLVAADGFADDQFGRSVSISGDYIVVGAEKGDKSTDITDSGSAYVFHRTGSGVNKNTWDTGTKLVALDGAINDRFGRSVSIYGDDIVIGADRDIVDGVQMGSAYVYTRTGPNTWDLGKKIIAPDGVRRDNFGTSVFIYNNYLLVGSNGLDKNGSVYLFNRTGGNNWDFNIKLLAPDGARNDSFGVSVAISNDYIIIGAHKDDDIGNTSGSAYSFTEW